MNLFSLECFKKCTSELAEFLDLLEISTTHECCRFQQLKIVKKQNICNMNKDMASLFRIIEDKWLIRTEYDTIPHLFPYLFHDELLFLQK